VDDRERASLVEAHLDLPRKVAATIHARCRDHVELDELVALGNAGLAEAAARFDPSQGASFKTFAHYRVQGAMIDALRRMSALPRRVWAQLQTLRAASEYLENRAAREAGAQLGGAADKTTTEQLAAVRDALGAVRTVYLTSLASLGEHQEPAADDEPVTERLDRRRMAERLGKAIDTLPDRERQLMVKHYWEGKNLLEAGAELGVSKSWASRLHAQAVDRLRGLLDDEPR
jgi:RNA polymerase sigma factor for flagellar operon FliA